MQIETVLDESTAELAKFEFAPLCTTAEASFKFKKSVPLHTTLQIDCKVLLLLSRNEIAPLSVVHIEGK